jgi:Family of unknown function (DUF6152)
MRANYFLVSLLAVGLLAAFSPALTAHHSVSAEFDLNKPIEFDGTVKKVLWMNPHIYTEVEAKGPDGNMVVYRVEGGPPNSLYRSGWRADAVKPGDKVHVKGNRAKSATSFNVGQAQMTTADGRRIFAGNAEQ